MSRQSVLSCIICCDKITLEPITTGKNIIETSTYLTELFETFCKYNDWGPSAEPFNFDNEPFPFCTTCKHFVIEIYQLDNNIETILKQIRQIVTKVSSKIVLSEAQRQKSHGNETQLLHFTPTNSPNHADSSQGKSLELMSGSGDEKNLYYRSLTLTRFSPNVSLGNHESEDEEETSQVEESLSLQKLHSHVLKLVKLEDDASDEDSDASSIGMPPSIESTPIKCEIVIKEEPEESLSFLANRDELLSSEETNMDFNSENDSLHLMEQQSQARGSGAQMTASSPDEASGKPKGNKCVQISSTKFIYAQLYPFEVIENRFQCGSCSFFTLKKRCNLLQHIRSNHMSGVQKHICQTCGKSYSNKICYKFHLETHTDNPSYTCEFCGKEFKLIYNYRSHKRYSHGGDDLKKYECKYCGKKFWKNREMTLHSKIHTERNVPKSTCKICGEVVDKKSIELHIKELHFA